MDKISAILINLNENKKNIAITNDSNVIKYILLKINLSKSVETYAAMIEVKQMRNILRNSFVAQTNDRIPDPIDPRVIAHDAPTSPISGIRINIEIKKILLSIMPINVSFFN